MLVVNGRMGAWQALAGFAAPALLGNIVGGTVLFAVLSHAQVMREI
jgi:formate/nitrite transporter FocA (FNT family)